MAEHLAASAESRSGPSCEKESEVRSENDSEEEETYLFFSSSILSCW